MAAWRWVFIPRVSAVHFAADTLDRVNLGYTNPGSAPTTRDRKAAAKRLAERLVELVGVGHWPSSSFTFVTRFLQSSMLSSLRIARFRW